MKGPRVRFGPYELHFETGELLREGEFVRLEPLPTDLLKVLLGRPGRLVLRSELLGDAWPAAGPGSERALNTAIRQIRDALGDTASGSRYIETHRGRGYRFAHPVTVIGESSHDESQVRPDEGTSGASVVTGAPKAPRRLRTYVAGGLLAASLALVSGLWMPGREGVTRIAVLPFDVLGDVPGGPAVGMSLTEDLITQLSSLDPDRVEVIARTSSARLAGGDRRVSEIGEALGVDYVVEGSVRPVGEVGVDSELTLTARLVRAGDEGGVWSDVVRIGSRELVPPAALAARIGASLTGRTYAGVALSPAEALTAGLPEADRTEFLKGRHLLASDDLGAWRRSVSHFDAVLERIPDHGPSLALRAEALARSGAYEEAARAAHSALRADPSSPEALRVRALSMLVLDRNVRGAAPVIRAARDLGPNRVETQHALAFHLLLEGESGRAIELMEKAARLDPVSAILRGDLGFFYYAAGQPRRALERCIEAHRLSPELEWPLFCAFDAASVAGDRRAAGRAAAGLLGEDPAAPSADVVERFRSWRVERLQESAAAGLAVQYQLALALTDEGRHDDAVAALRAARDEPSLGALTAGFEPRLDPLRRRADARSAIEALHGPRSVGTTD